MAKLGEQVAQVQGSRVTRTQRIVRRREVEKERARLQKEWEEGVAIEGKKFVGVTSIDEYETKYKTVPAKFQPAFVTPTQLRKEKQEKIDKNLLRANEMIDQYKKKIKDAKKDRLEHRIWWDGQNSKYKSRESNRESYKRALKGYDDKMDKYDYYIGYWQNAKGSYLIKGHEYGDVQNWVSGKVDYRMARQEAKREAMEKTKANQKILDEANKEDIHIITEYKDGKVQIRKTYVDTGAKKWTLIATQKPIAVKGRVESKLGKMSFQETVNIGGKKITFPSTSQIYEKGDKSYTEFGEVTMTKVPQTELPPPPEETPEEILAEYKYPTDTRWEKKAYDKTVEGFKEGWSYIKEKPTKFFFIGSPELTKAGLKEYKKSDTAQEIVGEIKDFGKRQAKFMYQYSGAKSVVLGAKTQWAFLGESKIGQKEIGLKIPQIDRSGKISYIKYGKLDEQYQGIIDAVLKSREEKVRPALDKRNQKLFESMYLQKIYDGEIEGEEAIKRYQESKEYKELQKQYELETARVSTWTGSAKILYAKIGQFITPQTYGGAVKGAEAVVGSVIALKVATPIMAKVQATKVGSWAIIGGGAGLTAYSGVKIRDPTLTKEERIKAIGFTAISGTATYIGLAQKLPILKTPFQYGKIGVHKLSGGRLYKGYDPSLSYKYRLIESTTRPEIPKVPYKSVAYEKLKYGGMSAKNYLRYTSGARTGKVLGTGSRMNIGRTTFHYKLPIRVRVPDVAKVGHFRRKYGLWDLYGTPSGEWVKVPAQRTLWQRLTVGKPLKRLLTGKKLLAKAEVIRRLKPQEVYGGYIGIGSGKSAQTTIVYGNKRYIESIRYLKRAKIPTGWKQTDLKKLVEQVRAMGQGSKEFTISAETLKGMSSEKQVNIALGQVLQKAPKGYYQPLQNKWFYYKQVPEASGFAQKVLPSKYFAKEILGGVEKTVYKSRVAETIRRGLFTDRILVRSRELQPLMYKTAVARGLVKEGVPYQDLIPEEKIATGFEGVRVTKKGEIITYIKAGRVKPVPTGVPDIVKTQAVKQRLISQYGVKVVSGEYLASQTVSSLAPILYSISKSRGHFQPSLPSVPSSNRVLSYSSVFSVPSTPSVPSIPSVPSAPSMPSVPSIPSVPSVPSTPTSPTPPVYAFYFPFGKKRKKRKKKLTDLIYGKAYIPDFTSKIVGLDAVEVDTQQAQKLLKRVQTGIEIRRGVKLKR